MQNTITERIKELEEKNRLIADNLIDAIWVLDAESLDVEFITPSIEKISGYSIDEYKKMSIQERMTPDLFKRIKALVNKEISEVEYIKPETRKLEIALPRKSGKNYWLEVRARLVKEKNQSLKIVGISRDITRRKISELKQQKLVEELEDALTQKEKLLKELKILRGLLPICSGCKRIKDENGKWWPLEIYVKEKTDADFTHTICTDCKDIYYKNL